jgi:putative transposase
VLSEHGVPIAPRTFYAWASRAPSKRALWDATITEILAGYYEPDEAGRRKPESLYGSLKMWAHLQRDGIPVAKSTVERLMRRNGWQGVRRQKTVRTTMRRQKTVRTTIADPTAARPPDLVDRQFGVGAPNLLLVADFKCRRRHFRSYADPRNMPTVLAMVQANGSVEVQKVGIVA